MIVLTDLVTANTGRFSCKMNSLLSFTKKNFLNCLSSDCSSSFCFFFSCSLSELSFLSILLLPPLLPWRYDIIDWAQVRAAPLNGSHLLGTDAVAPQEAAIGEFGGVTLR